MNSGLRGILFEFLAAIQFLTLLPPIVRRDFTPREMGRAAAYYPLVGLLIGAILAAAQALLTRLFPPLPSAALLLALWVLLTGGLHIDGFLDACDGLLGGSTAEQRLEIMRDHRIGAFAFTGGALLLLVKFAALTALPDEGRVLALILAPVLGRWSMSLALIAFPYARSQGLGKDIKEHAYWPHAVLSTALAIALAVLAGGWSGIAAAGLATLVTWSTARFALARIPGLTGDVYGMLNELCELAVLLLFCALAG